jgi:hypothetical protein
MQGRTGRGKVPSSHAWDSRQSTDTQTFKEPVYDMAEILEYALSLMVLKVVANNGADLHHQGRVGNSKMNCLLIALRKGCVGSHDRKGSNTKQLKSDPAPRSQEKFC